MALGINITDTIQTFGVLGIAAIVFAESGLLVGFLLPGDTLLFAAGFLTHQGVLNVNIHLLVFIIFVAAVVGDNVGYFMGHKWGRRLFRKPDSILFHQKNLQRAEQFYEKFGPITIIVARFTPLVRTFAPVVAGIGSMKFPIFMMYNLVGGLLWAASVTYLGYYGGAFLEERGINVELLVMPVILFAIFISVASPLWHILREKESRELLLRKLRIKKKTSS
jgi:membrane-associated protein